MTESVSSTVNISAVQAAMAAMYVPAEERVLDPTKADQSLLDRMPDPTGGACLFCRTAAKARRLAASIFLTKLWKKGRSALLLATS
jgi:hypothetical protein